MQAVEYERVLWEGAGPADANQALVARAECLIVLERWADAADALDRLRLYAVPPEEMPRVNWLKTLCAYRKGDYPAAYSFCREGLPDTPEAMKIKVLALASARQFAEAKELALGIAPDPSKVKRLFRKAPTLKSEIVATYFALSPPMGHIYLNNPEGWWVTPASYASMAFAIWQIIEGNWVTAILGGGTLLDLSYMEQNVLKMQYLTAKYNSTELEKFLTQLEGMLQ